MWGGGLRAPASLGGGEKVVVLDSLNPQDMQQYLQGVTWSADKEQVARTAESNGAPQGMLDQLRNLGDDQFSGPQDPISGPIGGV